MTRVVSTGIVTVFVFSVGLLGCAASPQPSTFDIAAGRYAEAFEIAKDQLRAAGFELARVDARAGVIETYPKNSAGLATPWSGMDTTFGQSWESFLNDQRRRAVVRFGPPAEDLDPDGSAVAAGEDLRQRQTRLEGQIQVVLERIARPGLRVQTASVRLSSKARDPQLEERGLSPWYAAEVGSDEWLAGRLAERIGSKLSDEGLSSGASAE